MNSQVPIFYYDLPAYKSPTEDRISKPIISDEITILGMFDGHGGSTVSEVVHKILPRRIKLRIGKSQDILKIQEILVEEFIRLDSEIIYDFTGSTATIAVITKTHVIVANIGDSPALIFKPDGTLLYSTNNHNCENNSEYERIKKAGGRCSIVQGKPRLDSGLSVTRAFGDHFHNKQIVIAKPEVYAWPRESKTYLCLCSDSFFEAYYKFEEWGQTFKTIGNINSAIDVAKEITDTLKKNDFDVEKSVKAAVRNRVASLEYEGDNCSLLLAYFS